MFLIKCACVLFQICMVITIATLERGDDEVATTGIVLRTRNESAVYHGDIDFNVIFSYRADNKTRVNKQIYRNEPIDLYYTYAEGSTCVVYYYEGSPDTGKLIPTKTYQKNRSVIITFLVILEIICAVSTFVCYFVNKDVFQLARRDIKTTLWM